MINNYLFVYIINPLFLLLDYIYQYTNKSNKKQEEKIEKYEYDIVEDKLKITYFSNDGNKYMFKFNRKLDVCLYELIDGFKNMEKKEILYGVSINGNDILNRVLLYLGPSGIHNNIQKLLVKDVLTKEEINDFEKLVIVDELCEVKELTDLYDYIL